MALFSRRMWQEPCGVRRGGSQENSLGFSLRKALDWTHTSLTGTQIYSEEISHQQSIVATGSPILEERRPLPSGERVLRDSFSSAKFRSLQSSTPVSSSSENPFFPLGFAF